jgi:hypothetical protein
VLDGQYLTVTWKVANDGPDTAQDGQYVWTDRVSLLDGSGNVVAVLGTFVRSLGVVSGGDYTRSETFLAPLLQGLYRVQVEVDVLSRLPDPDRANGTALTDFIQITPAPRPDLQITSVVAPTQTVTAGTAIDVQFTVENLGTGRTPTGQSRWKDAIFLSLDGVFSASSDFFLGEFDNGGALGLPGGNDPLGYTTTVTVPLPKNVAGNVTIFVVADWRGQISEFPFSEVNATPAPLAIDAVPVIPPDLVVTSLAGPQEAFDGGKITSATPSKTSAPAALRRMPRGSTPFGSPSGRIVRIHSGAISSSVLYSAIPPWHQALFTTARSPCSSR